MIEITVNDYNVINDVTDSLTGCVKNVKIL